MCQYGIYSALERFVTMLDFSIRYSVILAPKNVFIIAEVMLNHKIMCITVIPVGLSLFLISI